MSTQAPRVIAPRNIVPLAFEADQSLRPHALEYHGGPLLSSVEVVTIFWGRFWALAAGTVLADKLNVFFDVTLRGALMQALAEYSTARYPIGPGARIASFADSLENPGTLTTSGQTVTDVQIRSRLRQWIEMGKIPAPTANTLYFLYLSPAVISQQGPLESCKDYCGYHHFSEHVSQNIYYAVEPFPSCPACSFGTDFDTLTKASSHELCEAITDPELNGWFDPSTGNEVGDICNSRAKRLDGYLVQELWSNQRSACGLPKP
ncbi:MAG: hypothetical protein JOZ43_00660 [Acidobacteriales bacterium]|nr:hypothetical protein [Terriglobales bacterium]